MTKKLLAALVMVVSASPLFARAEAQAERQTTVGTYTATYYAHRYEGRRTASGETFRHAAHTAAHATLPFGTLAVVTHVRSGRSVVVRITDRLPSKRTVDLSRAAAAELKMLRAGRVKVRMDVLEPPQAR